MCTSEGHLYKGLRFSVLRQIIWRSLIQIVKEQKADSMRTSTRSDSQTGYHCLSGWHQDGLLEFFGTDFSPRQRFFVLSLISFVNENKDNSLVFTGLWFITYECQSASDSRSFTDVPAFSLIPNRNFRFQPSDFKMYTVNFSLFHFVSLWSTEWLETQNFWSKS